MKAKLGLEMIAVDQDRRMAFKTYSGPIDWAGEYVLEPTADGGSSVDHKGTMTFHGLWRLFEPIVGGELARGGAQEMERMKAAVEGPQATGQTT
jgi:hypothetical protein